MEAAAIRAAWSTAAVNQHAGSTPGRPGASLRAPRSPLNLSRLEEAEYDASNLLSNPALSPNYNRSRLGQSGVHGNPLLESTPHRGQLDYSLTAQYNEGAGGEGDHAHLNTTTPFEQYKTNTVLEQARQHGTVLGFGQGFSAPLAIGSLTIAGVDPSMRVIQQHMPLSDGFLLFSDSCCYKFRRNTEGEMLLAGKARANFTSTTESLVRCARFSAKH
jgi:hypothetical protein